MSYSLGRSLAALIVAFSVLVATGPAYGKEKTQFFDIPAQSLSSAILAYSKQANVLVVVAPGLVAGRSSPGVAGSFTPSVALEKLLTNTGLTAKRQVDGGFTLAPEGQVGKEGKTASSAGFRVAQVDRGTATGGNSMRSERRHSDNEDYPPLREVIVTAQKYRQRAFDVPISLQVISGDVLEQHGITDLSNLQYAVPGLYMNSTGYTHSVYLRGVGNGIGNGAMVGEYIDEADITTEAYPGATGYATGDNALYDLDRVEVLKGPQGTLYGDGSMGGVIRYITNKPALDAFQMSADVASLFTEDGAPGQRIETMLNTPLVEGNLGLRFSGVFEHDGGWVDEPAASLKNINGENVTDVRAQARWQPMAHFQVNLMEIVHRHTFGLGTDEDGGGNITPLFETTLVPNGTDSSNLSNLTMTYDFSEARLLSSSTYTHEDQDFYNLFDSASAGALTYWVLDPYTRDNDQAFSQEVRLDHAGKGPWQWMVGGYYKDFRDQEAYNEYFGLAGSSLSEAFYIPPTPAQDSSKLSAGFVNTSYEFFNRVTVGAGVRYSKDRETFVRAPAFPFKAATFTSTDPRFDVQYRLTPHVNAYASVSKGFRSGGFNLPPTPPYQPETLWSDDLGIKVRFPRQGLQADVDLFHMNYSNFVQTVYIPPTYQNSNVGRARIDGIDADLTWQPANQWRLGIATEILDSRFITASPISGYAVGNRLPFAPKYSLTASVQRDFHWGDRHEEAELYYYEISRVQVRALGQPVQQSDVLHFLNARYAIHWSESLQLGLFVHNLLNDRGYESPEPNQSIRPRPRTFGIEFGTSFR